MGKRSLFLVVSISAVTVAALAQEIVIEPTNGRAQQSKVKVTRPAAVESTPAKQTEVKEAPKPKPEAHIVTKAPARKASLKQASAKPKPVAPPPAMAEPAPAKVEAPAPAAPPKKEVPTRPAWAATDTRDARALQAEIANALARDPKLQGSSIKVTVDDSAVTLEGQATGTEERLQATRLAQSYAWNRKLLDRIEVMRAVSAQK